MVCGLFEINMDALVPKEVPKQKNAPDTEKVGDL